MGLLKKINKSTITKASSLLAICLATTSCQVGYVINNAWQGGKILWQSRPIVEVIQDSNSSDRLKNKLRLAQAAHKFAIEKLGLTRSTNYTQYVDLKRDYVSWIATAAPTFSLKAYKWWFPIVGNVPYKGYFSKPEAQAEADKFDTKEYDTYVRGVSAFSTLGWFSDPLLSSMLSGRDIDLVELIIHETVHTTMYFKNQADFNEKIATFVGQRAAELYYKNLEGKESNTLQKQKARSHDQKIFNKFIEQQRKQLQIWYKSLQGTKPYKEKEQRLTAIKNRFKHEILPKMKTNIYREFPRRKLNNAVLSHMLTYFQDLQIFSDLLNLLGGDLRTLVKYCKNLQDQKDPMQTIKKFVNASANEL